MYRSFLQFWTSEKSIWGILLKFVWESFSFILQLLHTVTKVGTSNTICVNAGGSYAVIYISPKQIITCASCHRDRTSCKHVLPLSSLIDSCLSAQEDIPSALQPFASLLQSAEVESAALGTCEFQPSHVSRKSIPFSLPAHLSTILCLPYSERFNLCGTSISRRCWYSLL